MLLDCDFHQEMLGWRRPSKALERQAGSDQNRYWSSEMADSVITSEFRVCEACGAQYPKKPGVSRGQFQKSRSCSRACALTLGRSARLRPSLAERFWAKVDKSAGHGPNNDCWAWTGYRDAFGYGRINRRDFRGGTAHRTSYDLNVGQIPDGMLVRHRCDNPSCVRPEHLELGVAQDNSDDQVARARQRAPKGENSRQSKLTEIQVRAIFADPRKQRDIAAAYGISQSAVMMIKTKRNWRHLWSDD